MSAKVKHFGHCIICHQDNVELSDEHIIPEAIGGYYHCYKICNNCNPKMGSMVDKYLLDHFLIKAARHEHKLRGYSNTIPNPLTGDAYLETGEKVRVEDEGGLLKPRILPQTSHTESNPNEMHITIDARDENQISQIQNKLLKKAGFAEGNYKIESNRVVHIIENPLVHAQIGFDLKNYKIGLLKIAYEFCVELFPDYEVDGKGRDYSKILHEGSLDRLDEVVFVNNGLNNDPFSVLLSQFIDYSNRKRHLILFYNYDNKLYCMVKLFDKFCQIIQMSDSQYGNNDIVKIIVNDFEKRRCEMFTLEELIDKTCHDFSTSYIFDDDGMTVLSNSSKEGKVGFYANVYGDNIVYDSNGKPVMTQEMLINNLDDGDILDTTPTDGSYKTIYQIPPGHYLMLAPTNQLIQLKEIVDVSNHDKY